MAKRITGVGKMKTSHSKKTKKRLVIKREMLASRQRGLAKMVKKNRKNLKNLLTLRAKNC